MLVGQVIFWTLVALMFGCPILAQFDDVDSVVAYSIAFVALLLVGIIGATL
jgi:hypothetical protein